MAITEAKKKRVWERSDHRCTYCHRELTYQEVTMDHIMPKSAIKKNGYADEEGNLCVCCKICNNAKASMTVSEFRKWVNTRNNELLKLEADRRDALARVAHLSQQIDGRRFTYIHHLRKSIM